MCEAQNQFTCGAVGVGGMQAEHGDLGHVGWPHGRSDMTGAQWDDGQLAAPQGQMGE